MIFRPQFSHDIYRIQAINPDHQEEEQKGGGKRRVLHQGRSWEEADEDGVPLRPKTPNSEQSEPKRKGCGVYVDKVQQEKARCLFDKLTTIEEKVAQLCFLVTEAIYDASLQKQIEQLIQNWQVGGVLFHKGDYRRQAYLIERYQEISKTPLLIGNDYLHGLSFYLQGNPFPKNILSDQHWSDIGKAVMVQNRRLGVHIQFDRERGLKNSIMTESQSRAFRRGIRSAHGIVACEKKGVLFENYAQSLKITFSTLALKEGQTISSTFLENQIQESIGFKTLSFFDATKIDQAFLEDRLLEALKNQYDVLLFSENAPQAVRILTQLVLKKKIAEEFLDRLVMKALIIKSSFF